jgi:two-component system, NarL family, response regulator NreC
MTTNLDKYATLTSCEREVLHLVAEGLTNQEIATRLGISSRSAETHRSNLMHKLDLHTQADLIRFALRRGIIPIEE